jgi:hypothetical protein
VPDQLTYYRLPGWASIDVGPSSQQQLTAAVAAMVRDLPPEARSTISGQLHAELDQLVMNLGEIGAFRLLLPASGALTQPVRPVVALFLPDGEEDDPVDSIIAIAASDPSAHMMDLPGRVGIKTRTEHDSTEAVREGVETHVAALAQTFGFEASGSAQQVANLTRVNVQVRYHFGIPGENAAWLSVFATFGHEATDDGRGAAELAEALLDDWVRTVRWTDAE